MYPIVEGYKDAAAFGLRFNVSDPVTINLIDFSASYSPSRRVDSNERVHLAAAYRRYDWTVQAKRNNASFYDLVGPTKVGRKGYSAGVTYKHNLFYDPPRAFELTTALTG